MPGIKNKIKAFVQWTRDKIRMGEDPALEPFPVTNVSALLRRYQTHEKYIKDSSTLLDAAKPKDLNTEPQ